MKTFIDTNILLYSIQQGADAAAKQEISQAILDSRSCGLSVQVLNEFMWQSTHRRQATPLSLESAMALILSWRRHSIQLLDLQVFDSAAEIARRTNYSWWDSLIVAAAVVLGCDTLATEDMQHGRVIDGVRIVNPFRALA